MAKESQTQKPAAPAVADVQRLAEQLFIANWKPTGMGITSDAFAAMCFRGAQQFRRVASQLSEGRTVEDIISPPEAVATPTE